MSIIERLREDDDLKFLSNSQKEKRLLLYMSQKDEDNRHCFPET